ncbi:LysR family transcriptional regulator [Serratia sp. 2723]|uniref:LysR family transcriptional regulator n=1 Tax=unclassified Serratia (in: enterobacteria) TaxID=2647522 RepID=UPI003D1AE942
MGYYLDIYTVEAFLKVAELNSFTLAAESLCITQAGVTVKIQKLEKFMGQLLFHRTPRQVYLSPEGERFLPKARMLLNAHLTAMKSINVIDIYKEIVIGISEHIVDHRFMFILYQLRQRYPDLLIKTIVEDSSSIFQGLQNKKIDIAIITRTGDKQCGEHLRWEHYGWYGAANINADMIKLPLITLKESCRLRKLIINLLVEHGRGWYDSFQGGGVNTILAAVKMGLGVAALPRSLLSWEDQLEVIEVTECLNLPKLPSASVVIDDNCLDLRSRELLRDLVAMIRQNEESSLV